MHHKLKIQKKFVSYCTFAKILKLIVMKKILLLLLLSLCVLPMKAKQSFLETKRLAEQGDASAQFNLGDCYHNGEGVEKNDARAVYWYRNAAEQGMEAAQKKIAEL